MHPDYLELIAECQPHTVNLNSELLYEFYLDILPKQKFFTKYISSKSEKLYPHVVSFLSDKLNTSISEMEDYLVVLLELDGGIELIRDEIKKYGYDDKTLKKEFGI